MRLARDGFQIEAAKAKNKPMPEWVNEEPEIQPLDAFFIQAFDDLNTCRHDGGAIPWRDIMVYGKEYVGLDNLTISSFVKIMREMDSVFLKWHSKKDTIKKSKRSGKSPVNRPKARRKR